MANLQTKTPPCLLLGDREWTCSLVSHQGYEITTFLALGDIADEPRMVTERETKLDIQPENESLVHRPVRLSVAASLAPDWRNTPQRLAGLTRRMGTPMCGIWNNIFLLTTITPQSQGGNLAFWVGRTLSGAGNTLLPFGST